MDQVLELLAVGGQERLDALAVDVGDDDVPDLLVDVAEQAVGLHLLGLVAVVLGRADVVDREDLVAVEGWRRAGRRSSASGRSAGCGRRRAARGRWRRLLGEKPKTA